MRSIRCLATGAAALLLASCFRDSLVRQAPMWRTVADVRNIGTSLMSWLTDTEQVAEGAPVTTESLVSELGAAPPAATPTPVPSPVALADYTRVTHAKVTSVLVPKYMDFVPEHDAWDHPFEFYLTEDFSRSHIMLIRSPGEDGRYEGEVYTPGPFDPLAVESDIVWADGFLVRWPQRPDLAATP